MPRAPLKNIYFGEQDALHEFMKQDRSNLNILELSFVNPPRVNLGELIDGSRFLIVGPKGSGKTTLLWYLKRTSDIKESSVILFKSEIRKEDRDQLDTMTDIVVNQDQKKFSTDADYKTIWEWYILKNFFRLVDPKDVYEGIDVFRDILLLLEIDSKKFSTMYDNLYVDKVRGKIKVGINFGALKSELSAELKARRNDENRMHLLDLVRLVQGALKKIKIRSKVRIYFDELEFFVSDDGDGERDRRMVRDLLISVYNANRIFGGASLDAIVYASVRSEIIASINTTSQELGKITSAFGVNIDWESNDYNKHPALDIVKRKIQQSEIQFSGAFSEDVWKEYFPEKVMGDGIKKYILDGGTHRPRGIILRLTTALKYAFEKDKFEEQDFIDSELEFGNFMLSEFVEELSATFNEPGREAILSMLRGKRFSFTRDEMKSRLLEASNLGKDARLIRDQFGADGILRILFRIGMIGNQFEVAGKMRQRWAVRGEVDPFLEQKFVLHKSIRRSLTSI